MKSILSLLLTMTVLCGVSLRLNASPVCTQLSDANTLYKKLSVLFSSSGQLLQSMRAASADFGVPQQELSGMVERIADNPALIQYMRGVELIPPKQKNPITMIGGWGAERLFVPHFLNIWNSFFGRAPTVLQRYQEKLKFDNDLINDLAGADIQSAGDSGWIVLLSGSYDNIDYSQPPASLKVLNFDPNSPVGFLDARMLAPSGQDQLDSQKFLSAFEDWGLLSLEKHTGWRIPEHDPDTYNGAFPALFSQSQRQQHGQLMFKLAFDAMNPDAAASSRKRLLDFRKQIFPEKALRVAELGRFNIPPNMREAGAKAQIFTALLALIKDRPIDVFYLEAPIVDPKNDVLRAGYESLGFKVVKTFNPAQTSGFANGANVMRASREDLRANFRNLLLNDSEMRQSLTPEQITWLGTFL